MTSTEINQDARLIDQLEARLKPTGKHQYAVVVERRLLVRALAALRQSEQRIAAIEMAASKSTNDLVAELMQLRAKI